MHLDDGYLRIGTWNGTQVRVHFTAPILIVALSGFRFAPSAWLGVALVIFVHEVGHAILVRRCGGTAISIDFTGVGGECRWVGVVGRFGRCLIAWGGVAAQTVLLVVACVALPLLRGAHSTAMQDLVYALTASNVLMVLVNLLPFRPFDGGQAWRIVPLGIRALGRARRRVSARMSLRRLERLERREPAHALPPEIAEQLRRISEEDRT